MNNDLEEIRQKLNIVEFIGQYVNLKKAGANFKGVCPFHDERTPSLMVSPDKQIFKCFGCLKGGDIFTFLQEREGLSFPETVKLLADRAGVTLSQSNTPTIGSDKKNRLFSLNKLVSTLFHKLLTQHPSGKPALDYLTSRGTNIETIKQFNIGWAPNNMSFLYEFGRKKGYREQDFSEIGAPERLRGRITFPLTDILGNVIGFSGRALDPDRQPKYLNTPDTIIFHKSNVIFNLSNCRDAIKKSNRIVLVEGQMDVVASVQAGITETVATSGTALTENQLRILYRYSDRLIIAYDSDTAGINATKRAIQLGLPIGFTIYIAQVTDAKDPGDMAISNPEGWKKLIESPTNFFDWLSHISTDNNSKTNTLSPENKKRLAKELVPIIRLIIEPIVMEEVIKKFAVLLQISTATAEELIANSNKNDKTEVATASSATQKDKKIQQKDWLTLGFIYLYPAFIAKLNKKITFDKIESDKIYKTVQKGYNDIVNKGEDPSLKNLKKRLDRETTILLDEVAFEIQNDFDLKDKKTVSQIFADIISHYNQKDRDDQIQDYAQAIRKAEESGNREKVKDILTELSNLIK